MSEQPKTPKLAVAEQSGEFADSAAKALESLTPADKSWVAGFVIVVLIIVGSDAYVGIKSSQDDRRAAERMAMFLEAVETNRAQEVVRLQQSHSDEIRRYQEAISHLVDAVVRDSERSGRIAVESVQRTIPSLPQSEESNE